MEFIKKLLQNELLKWNKNTWWHTFTPFYLIIVDHSAYSGSDVLDFYEKILIIKIFSRSMEVGKLPTKKTVKYLKLKYGAGWHFT